MHPCFAALAAEELKPGFMRFYIIVLALLAFFATPAFAQTAVTSAPAATDSPSAAPAAASVDEFVKILEDDKARAALITRLRERSGEPMAAPQDENAGFVRQAAEYTKAIAENGVDALRSAFTVAGDIAAALSNPAGGDFSALRDAAVALGLAALGLFAAFFVLRIIAAFLVGAVARRVAGRRWPLRLGGLITATAIDAVAAVAAFGAGYVIALQVVGGPTGRMGINQTLLLNAFLSVEVVKVALRSVLEPRHPPLRLLPVGDTTAAYWYFWLARIASLIGYAFLFVAPIVAVAISPPTAQAVRVLAMLTAVVIGIIIVLQNRDQLRCVFSARTAAGRHDPLSRTLGLFANVWHYFVIAYLIALFVVWLVNPRDALGFMLAATARSLVALLVGWLVLVFIRGVVSVGLRLPEEIRLRLPLLEARLNAFVPRVMQIVRTLVLIGTALAIAEAWGLIDFLGWLGSRSGRVVVGSALSATLIVLVGFVLYVAVASWVEYRLNPEYGSVPTAREKTLLALFRNAFTIALFVLVAMLALAQIGVNIAPLLAGAGVLGLAIGFGAQKFVQDIITGAFIQFENIMNEGDVVEAGGKSGVVERLTIRSVSIRDLSGTLHLIPFSSVEMVSNMMKGFSFHVADIGVAYRENVAEVKEAMLEAFDLLLKTDHREAVIGPLEMHGVTQLGDSAVVVRARIRTLPGSHWAVGRAYNEIIKEVFDRRGIEIPYPHLTVYMGEDKKGWAPPLRMASAGTTRKVEEPKPAGEVTLGPDVPPEDET